MINLREKLGEKKIEQKYISNNIMILSLPYLISGTVIELSAMFVDRITFLKPLTGFSKTRACSSIVMVEWSGIKVKLFFDSISRNVSNIAHISLIPLKT